MDGEVENDQIRTVWPKHGTKKREVWSNQLLFITWLIYFLATINQQMLQLID